MDVLTPPRGHIKPLDARNPDAGSNFRQRPHSVKDSHSAKDSFWSGASISGLIYGAPEASQSPPAPSTCSSYTTPSEPTCQPSSHPGEVMEQNLLRWAQGMGLCGPSNGWTTEDTPSREEQASARPSSSDIVGVWAQSREHASAPHSSHDMSAWANGWEASSNPPSSDDGEEWRLQDTRVYDSQMSFNYGALTAQ